MYLSLSITHFALISCPSIRNFTHSQRADMTHSVTAADPDFNPDLFVEEDLHFAVVHVVKQDLGLLLWPTKTSQQER
jgi:hypothetical protein